MTPKKKARELVDKYTKLYPSYVVMWQGDVDNAEKNIKDSALIVVNEVLNAIPNSLLDTWQGETYLCENENVEYWNKVKKEILKL